MTTEVASRLTAESEGQPVEGRCLYLVEVTDHDGGVPLTCTEHRIFLDAIGAEVQAMP